MNSKKTDFKGDGLKSAHLQNSGNKNDWAVAGAGKDLDEDERVPKWYEEFSDTPEPLKELSSDEIATLTEEARQVLRDESIFYSSKGKSKQRVDQQWIKTVFQKGTASDKVAAHVLKIQDSPVFNLSSLTTLVNMVKLAKKDFSFVMDALTDLFIDDLLPPNLKLRPLERQPFDQLGELCSGNAMARRRRLAFWAFEDELKKMFSQMLQSLDVIARDAVPADKEKVVSVLYKLLVSHPEQEDVILKMLVNKLGDTSQKVVSKVIYSLTQLLRVHEAMKQVVIDEVERLLFRPNVNAKAQYYAICFLSQFHFTINDDEVACKIISIYFSFFKASIKKGDVNSRMLGSLLMGLNRAYPYAKKKLDTLSDHVHTLYKLVHLADFNISLQCLRILFQISDSNGDRFYSVFYKKLSDLQLASSAHQAMFINLLYKALSNDDNIGRIRTFIKRILQLCALMPVPLTCGLLYLVSQLLNKRVALCSTELLARTIDIRFDVSDDEEHYVDVDNISENMKKVEPSNINSSLKEEDNNDNKDEAAVIKKEKSKEIKERKPCASWCHNVFRKQKHGFDPMARNPSYAEGESAVYTELVSLTRHFHPTVALFATEILENRVIKYTGDPLVDFTLVKFVERFVFKNPKKIALGTETKGPDPVLAPRKRYQPSGAKTFAVNSRIYLQQNEKDVPSDELFLFKYLTQRQQLGYRVERKEGGEEDDDLDSVASDEFEQLLENMMSKKDMDADMDMDFADDIGDTLQKREKGKKSKRKQTEDDEDDEIEEDEDELDDEEGALSGEEDGAIEDDDLDLSEVDDSDAEVMDFSGSEEDYDDANGTINKKGNKKVDLKKLRNDISRLFVPAEEFSEMLEDTGTTGYKEGTAQALSNEDRAGTKQLQWEMKRNDSMNNKRKWKNNNFKKGKRRKF